MSNYTITTDFGAKDSLPSSNSAKVVRGSEFTTEFTNIQTAIATKADTAGDTFTGVVNFSADVAVNTNTLFVDVSEARVGIGTTSPDSKLDVDGTVTIGGDGSSINFTGTVGSNFITAKQGLKVDIDSDNNQGATLFSVTSNNEANNVFNVKEDGDISFYDTAGTSVKLFWDASAESLGIGTTNPATALHIDSSGATALTLQRNSGASSNISIKYDGVSQDYYTGVASVSEDFVIGTSADLNGNNLLRVTSAGNVGIGTTNPIRALHVNSGNDTIRLQSTSTNTKIEMVNTVSTANEFGFLSDSFFVSPNGTEALRIKSSGNVGIGTTNPSSKFVVSDSGGAGLEAIPQTSNDRTTLLSYDRNTSTYQTLDLDASDIHLNISGTERMRIDSSGNVLIGTTDGSVYDNTSGGNTGFVYSPNGFLQIARETTTATQSVMNLNKMGSDGNIIELYKDGSTVGSIGSRGGTALFIESGGTTGTAGLDIDVAIAPRKNGALSDGQIDLGTSAYRFEDIYRSGSTYSTSDRNKKQDIRDLTDAEARVATVAKGSLKAFRYIDSVEAKGDEANIHFGIIAQDLKAAFEAEGLNANDYQVFKTSTYTDDDGVEQTTYSVCYENLLAFIIAAI